MQKTKDISKNRFDASSLKTCFENLFNSSLFYAYLGMMGLIILSLFFEKASLLLCAYVLFFVCVLGKTDTFGMLLFLYPFFSAHMYHGENLYFVIFFLSICVLAIKHLIQVYSKKEKIDVKLIIVSVLYILFLLLPVRRNAGGNLSPVCSLKYLASAGAFFVCMYVVYKARNEIDFLKCLHLFFAGLIISCVLGPFAYVSPRLQDVMSLIKYDGFDLIRFNGLFSVPNTLSIISLICASLVFYLDYKNRIGKVFYFYITMFFVLGYLTMTRVFLYAFAIAFVLYAIAIAVKDKRYCYKKLLPQILFFIATILILLPYTKVQLSRLGFVDLVKGYDVSQKENATIETVDPGRGGLIKLYLKDFVSSVMIILFGRGISYPWLGVGLSSHNTYLQAFWNTGVVGVILLIFAVLVFVQKYTNLKFKALVKSTFCDYSNYILFLPILALMFVENLFMNMQMIIMILLVVFALHAVKYDNLNKTEQLKDFREDKNVDHAQDFGQEEKA